MFAEQSSPIINPWKLRWIERVGIRYMNKLVCDAEPPVSIRRRCGRIVATARGQEVQLIRGSEWQTGVRLYPSGVPSAVHQGFEDESRDFDEDEG